ncbi:MAG: hypothetical protein IJ527_00560 [Prevotella sp.]|nr:hypothetical protein [Prevotella sp.]
MQQQCIAIRTCTREHAPLNSAIVTVSACSFILRLNSSTTTTLNITNNRIQRVFQAQARLEPLDRLIGQRLAYRFSLNCLILLKRSLRQNMMLCLRLANSLLLDKLCICCAYKKGSNGNE